MRLASFHAADGVRPAVVAGEEIVDLAAADRTLHASLAELLERGPGCLQRMREIAHSGTHRMPLSGLRLPPFREKSAFATPTSGSSSHSSTT